jgi:hypothetical protein
MNTTKTSAGWFDRHFQTVVMGLLLCIAVALSVLWLRERNRRIDAELALEEAHMELFVTRAVLEKQLPMLTPGERETAPQD